MSESPTARSLRRLRETGHLAEVVERRVPRTRTTRDLFGCIDILAVRTEPGHPPLGVQATSRSNVAARLKKSRSQPGLRHWLAAGCAFEVWGWGKAGKAGARKRWEVRRVALTLDDLAPEGAPAEE